MDGSNRGLQLSAVVRVAVGGLALMFLSGCAASSVMISKRNLDVQTKMSETIFLDPVSPDQKVMYVEVRNTSDKDNFELEGPINLKTAVNLSGRGSFCGRQGRRASGCEHECGERAGENRSQAFGIGPLLRSGFQ